MPRRVLIVDDNAFIRHAMRVRFEEEPDFEVCGEAENGKEAISEALQSHPDVVILDFSMPVMNGLDAARALQIKLPETVLVMFTLLSTVLEREARSVGISAVVPKSEPASVLVGVARGLLRLQAAA